MKSIEWQDDSLILLDQTRLPAEIKYICCRTAEDVAEAIKTMRVRGAPAIGVAAAYGLVLGALREGSRDKQTFILRLQAISALLGATRPTAVNLFWALRRMLEVAGKAETGDVSEIINLLRREAHQILREDLEMNKNIGRFGCDLVPPGAKILTHCNAGALATAGYGTALGVIRAAHEAGKQIEVFVDETRPLLQGARLTAWELMQDHIPVTLIADNTAGYLMSKGLIDLAVTGADRIAGNGDTANKIGTYTVAVLCKEHRIPFYIAAPVSTIDLSLASGGEIPIEKREAAEVTAVYGREVAPKGVKVLNPAFDITPNHLITALITDRGIIRPPYHENLKKIL